MHIMHIYADRRRDSNGGGRPHDFGKRFPFPIFLWEVFGAPERGSLGCHGSCAKEAGASLGKLGKRGKGSWTWRIRQVGGCNGSAHAGRWTGIDNNCTLIARKSQVVAK